MRPDHEITEVEERLARRRLTLESTVRETGRRAVKSLASPAVLIGVVALGFLAGAGVSRRPVAHDDRSDSVRKSSFTGLAMTAALWLVKQQLGNPAQIAHFVLGKLKEYRGAWQNRSASPPRRREATPGVTAMAHDDRPAYR